MKFNKIRFDENGRLLDDCNPLICNGGGKGRAPAPQPIIAPTPPIAEAGVVQDEDDKKILKKGKSTLKVPMDDKSLFGVASEVEKPKVPETGLKV